ncbi:flagellar protein FlgJ [Andreprevotia lacus DSM 23236]|jgi:flagellar protein FlgJ|uniref:Peptidoglycan hydrolase FlgJ n=1 Tax=Andreprevotia lacus DSM 23236 TaxID=1121001 RepID=A0A1W1WYS7_9NEIS|nr:flagellar assembly peptidoglycan hydrolase FlgJ [Andreprevotia lacus]SMC16859.1 flagellar protein FlgJ [Andreprevotia lacus DSM 23236]
MITQTANRFNNSLAIDVQAVDGLRQLAKTSPEQGTKAAAQQFESLLIQQMLSSMRAASPVEDELDSSSTKMFRGMQDQQTAQIWSQNGGVGLADSIVRQIQIQRDPSLLKQAQRSVPLGVPGLDVASDKITAYTGKFKPATAKDAAAASALRNANPLGNAGKTGGNTPASAADSGSFMGNVLDAASTVADALGVSSQVLAAHAALETGWGKKPIKDASGADSHNLFGIKAGSNWAGKTVDVTTTEYVNGAPQKRVEKFRAYDSYKDAFADYAQLIKRRFSDAMGQGSNAAGFGQALQQDGYATDPAYASKLARVADRVSRMYGDATSNIG